jgi:hypothetical protein
LAVHPICSLEAPQSEFNAAQRKLFRLGAVVIGIGDILDVSIEVAILADFPGSLRSEGPWMSPHHMARECFEP